ncbi:hypothetical protein [Micromonospora sp. LOL_021]|uniref:hypothetical protein n=1 Tax=Micromonospora sp. LOL_021 TaxID=3345417 RepID=UPI003A8363D0
MVDKPMGFGDPDAEPVSRSFTAEFKAKNPAEFDVAATLGNWPRLPRAPEL